ncbi:MAG: chemotaxis protein CheD [Pseudomonadota bacterium]
MPRHEPAVEYIRQSEVRIAACADDCFGAILGSCVTTILWDPERRVGGMNHLLLPSRSLEVSALRGHEVNLMELLINGVVQAGAARPALQAKVFGGARMINGLGSTGAANVAFVEGFLAEEDIPCVASSTGGQQARRLRVWPAIGRVQQLRLRERDEVTLALDAERMRRRALHYSGVELL